MAETEAPHYFRCPITQEIMRDPVIDPDGNSYERTAISQWLMRESTSPVTRAPLLPHQLKPNRALKEAIEEYQARSNGTEERLPARQSVTAVVPDHLKCKLSGELMSDPVTDTYGDSFERAAIVAYIYQRGVSPVDNSRPLSQDDLRSNDVLKRQIDEFKLQRDAGVVVSAPQHVPTSSDVIAELSMRAFKESADADTIVEIKIEPKEGTVPVPLDVIALIDVSQSMENAAAVPQAGSSVDVGFSVLDITKHALKTVIATMKENDRLAIVAFSDTAVLLKDLTYMTEHNKGLMRQRVMELHAHGCTNIWDALRLGLDTLEKAPRRECVSSLLFMTDGRPSEHLTPPRGITPSLEKRLARLQGVQPVIHAFGFGYDLDVPLLLSIAKLGNGSFSFIPDSGFVGTVLVHWIANLSTSFGVHAHLHLQPQAGVTVKRVLGHQNLLPVPLGSLHFGQRRTLLLQVENADNVTPAMKGHLQYTDCFGKPVRVPLDGQETVSSPAPVVGPFEEWLQDEQFRLEFVELLSQVVKNGRQPEAVGRSREAVAEFVRGRRSMAHHKAMADAEGQVSIAVSQEEYFRLWGQPYVCSLLLAHRQQRCNNFKDKGVANYGGTLFEDQRDAADDIFTSMPPPVPSRSAESAADIPVAPDGGGFSMAAYNDVDNPCFHENALVAMADGSARRCCDIGKGDLVATPLGGEGARVRCVVRTACQGGRQALVTLAGGLKVTPWHPVRAPGSAGWTLPAALGPIQTEACGAVYSFELEAGHVMCIAGWECVGLGHGLQEPVAQHDYYGTDRVISDLQKLPGYQEGMVSFRPGPVQRGADGKVIGFDLALVCPRALRSEEN